MARDTRDEIDDVVGVIGGRLIGGRFRVADVVSQGANTVIANATDSETNQPVTVKVVRPELASSQKFRRAFRRHAEVATALSHPNIATVIGWGDVDLGDASTVFWVVEHLDGGSMRDLCDRGRLLDPSQALVVGLEACRALDAAHQRGIVHTELTPAKMVFGADRRLRIVDFGFARLLGAAAWADPATVPTHVARYASPEQALGIEVDAKTDVYALALSLIEAVTGSVPFAADSTVATLAARIGKLMPVSADLGSLAAILERAGRPDAEDRSTAAELGKGLVQAAGKLPRPTPIPIVAGGLFSTSELRRPTDPTGGLARPPADAAGDAAAAAGAAAVAAAGIAAREDAVPAEVDALGEPSDTSAETPETAAAPKLDEPAGAPPAVSEDVSEVVSEEGVAPEVDEPAGAPPAVSEDVSEVVSEEGVAPVDEPAGAPPVVSEVVFEEGVAPEVDEPVGSSDSSDGGGVADSPDPGAGPGSDVGTRSPGAPPGSAGPASATPFHTGDVPVGAGRVADGAATQTGNGRHGGAPAPKTAAPLLLMTDVADSPTGAVEVGTGRSPVPGSGPAVEPTERMAVTSLPEISEIPEVYDHERARRPVGKILLITLVVLVGLAGLSYAGWLLLRTKSYDVPALAGVDIEVALNEVAGNDWLITIDKERSDEEPTVDRVIRTEPGPGVSLEEGEPFLIVVSEGPELRTLPEVTGAPLAEAEAELRDLRLNPAVDEREFSETVPLDSVISWRVEGDAAAVAGSQVLPDVTILLTVSDGPAPRPAPALAGLLAEQAVTEVESLQLVLARGEDVFSDTVPAGVVVSQDPAAGTLVPRGGTVTIQVSKGPDVVPVPDLTGLTYVEAEALLRETGFVVGDLLGSTEGTFVSMTINGEPVEVGQLFLRGTAVDLIFL